MALEVVGSLVYLVAHLPRLCTEDFSISTARTMSLHTGNKHVGGIRMKDKLEAILNAFGDYIRAHDCFDIVYSEKIGYVKLQVPHPESEVPTVMDTPETLLAALFNEIIIDAVFSPDNPQKEHSDPTLTEYEEAESRRRIVAILEQIQGEDKAHYLDFMDTYIKDYPENYVQTGERDDE